MISLMHAISFLITLTLVFSKGGPRPWSTVQ